MFTGIVNGPSAAHVRITDIYGYSFLHRCGPRRSTQPPTEKFEPLTTIKGKGKKGYLSLIN